MTTFFDSFSKDECVRNLKITNDDMPDRKEQVRAMVQ